MTLLQKLQKDLFSIFSNFSKKDLQIIIVFYLCSFLFLHFAHEFSFLIGFFSFYICALLLVPQTRVMLKPITLCSILHWPTFYILTTFFAVSRQGVSPLNILFLVFGGIAFILSMQIAIGYLATVYVNYIKITSLNQAMIQAFSIFIKNFFKSFLLYGPFAIIMIGINLPIETTVLIFYPILFLVTRKQKMITSQ